METRMLYVDSTERDVTMYPSGAQFTLHLTDPVKNISRVDLVAAKVPNTLYNLTSTEVGLTVAGTAMRFNPGFYSTSALASEITKRGSNIIYIPSEGKFFLRNTEQFDVIVHTTEMANMLGMSPGTTHAIPCAGHPVYDAFGGYFVKSSKVVDMSMNEFVFLDILELRTPGNLHARALEAKSGSVRNSFGMIPMDVDSGTVKSFKEHADYEMSATFPQPIDKLSRLTINWLDASGRPLDFQGLENNSFVLRIHTERPKCDIPPVPPLHDVELKRIVDALTLAPAPPKEDDKKIMGRWAIWIAFVLALVGYMVYRRAAPGVTA
jgi:hypothetical protein